jgi:hypothetical protein
MASYVTSPASPHKLPPPTLCTSAGMSVQRPLRRAASPSLNDMNTIRQYEVEIMTRRNRGVFWIVCGVLGTFAVALWASERQKAAADRAAFEAEVQKRAARLNQTSNTFLETEAHEPAGDEPPTLRIAK